ncbi:acyl-CoA carboxylase epsilon subunit [Thermomonospora sp. CIF 1]|uniref:acyl-CoA carboxylase epsilon subunit n=1 Tax=Thermomonospora sp. CIF 1 TaxID=1916083 RepID=UPI00257AB743|nr:acyl-CoA carboxylase epsilon subunit [Thermomonospora sp. CIF 1]
MPGEPLFRIVAGRPNEYDIAALAVVFSIVRDRIAEESEELAVAREANWLSSSCYHAPGDWCGALQAGGWRTARWTSEGGEPGI